MDDRRVMGTFSGLIVAGVALGLLTLLFPPPPQTGPPYSIAASVGALPAPQAIPGSESSVGATGTGHPAATGSAAPSGAASKSGVEDTQQQPADQPARVGAALAVVDNPPPATAAMLEPNLATGGSVYLVTFAPYGLGPSDGSQPQLVVKIISSAPRGTVAKPYQWANTNALVNLAPDSAGKVTKGGQYQGMLTLENQQGLLVPLLSRVAALRTH